MTNDFNYPLTGDSSSPWELLGIVATMPVGLWAVETTQRLVDKSHVVVTFMTGDLLCLWIPLLLTQSTWLYPWGVLMVLLLLIITLTAITVTVRHPTEPTPDINITQENTHVLTAESPRRAWLTNYRASILFLTFAAILGVDFPSYFPQRFRKTQVTGYSLMDLGAASFVIAAGWLSPRARRSQASSRTHTPHQTTTNRTNNIKHTSQQSLSFYRILRKTLPLWTMGTVRLLVHGALEYPTDVTEYGTHWNFFFTLALLTIVVNTIPGPSMGLPILIMTIYQYWLSFRGGQQWIVAAPRQCSSARTHWTNYQLDNQQSIPPCLDILWSNREGVLGTIGYAVLYLVSEWLGTILVWEQRSSRDTKGKHWVWLVCVCLSFGVWMSLDVMVAPSRRSVNITFLAWTLFVNITMLAAIQYLSPSITPLTFELVNRHGFVAFVVANLLTGLVNLCVDTNNVTILQAFVILLSYFGGIAVIVGCYDRLRHHVVLSWEHEKSL